MTHAYSEMYLDDAKDLLSVYFDYLVNDCNYDGDLAATYFWMSGYAERFEKGDPGVLAGMSGIELARAVHNATHFSPQPLPEQRFTGVRSPEYWAGWALAWYQWHTGRRFKDIFNAVPFSFVIEMYPLFHEMDVIQFFNAMDSRIVSIPFSSRLKLLRESRGLSQSEMAAQAGVNLRSIQMYEQGVNHINKAQAITLFRLSRVIGCRIEDLLENPRM